MKKFTMIVMTCLIIVFTINTSYAWRFSGGPKYADPKFDRYPPTKHMPGIVKLNYLGSTAKGVLPSKIFFRISFDKKVKHFDAFWSKKGDDVSENRNGIKIKNLGVVNGLYEYAVTFNTSSVGKSKSIDFFIGCYGPASGYPNLREISIVLEDGKPLVSIL